MGAVFGKGGAESAPPRRAPPAVTERDRAILSLKNQRDRLKQYQTKISLVVERETQLAKELAAAGEHQKALLCLRRKRYQEDMLKKTDQQLTNLEQLTASIEFAEIELRVVEGLKVGNAVLRELNEQTKIEDVERLMAETEEAQAYRDEISSLLSTKLSSNDDEEVLAELAALDLETLPAVPTHVPKARTGQAAGKVEVEAEADDDDDVEDEEADGEAPEPAKARRQVRQAVLS